jgi:hypothetical protein
VDIKSVIAVLGGMVLMYFLAEILEPPLVAWLASQRPASMDEYLIVRNTQQVLFGRLILTAVTGVLVGYVVAKIAGQHELAHAAAAAALQSLMLLRAFAADPPAAAVPFATRTAFVVVTAAAMLAGAAIRARAARLTAPTEVRS